MSESIKQLKNRKRNFTDCELEVMINQTVGQKRVLFGGLGSGFSNKLKQV